MEKRVGVLDSHQIRQKIKRIAHQIVEEHYLQKEIVVVGVAGSGFGFSELLAKELQSIDRFKVELLSLTLSKKNPLSETMELSGELEDLKGKVVILSDDVLNSGLTMMHAARHLLQVKVKGLYTATLIDRFHRKFPIRADYVGLTLSTNIKEHITVDLTKNKEHAYLV